MLFDDGVVRIERLEIERSNTFKPKIRLEAMTTKHNKPRAAHAKPTSRRTERAVAFHNELVLDMTMGKPNCPKVSRHSTSRPERQVWFTTSTNAGSLNPIF